MKYYKNLILNDKNLLYLYFQIVENMCMQSKESLDNILMSLDKHSSKHVDFKSEKLLSYIYRGGLPLPVSEDNAMSYIDKCSKICNLNVNDAANKLCEFLNVKLNFFTTNNRNYNEYSGPLLKFVPTDKSHFYGNEYLNFDRTGFDKVPLVITIKGDKFTRFDEHSILIHNFRGEVISIIFFYYCKESFSYYLLNSYMQEVYDTFDKFVCIPNLSSNNLFSNIHHINSAKYLDARIIIFEDKYLFLLLSDYINKQCKDFNNKFIITCRHADYSKESIEPEDFNIFKYRNVAYVPSFNKNVYINSVNILNFLNNFSDQATICPYPIVFKWQFNSDGLFTDESCNNRSDAWYKEIFSNLLIYDDYSVEDLLNIICEKSVSGKDFKKWMSGLGLISRELVESPIHQSNGRTVDELIALADKSNHSDKMSYDRLINPYDITFVYAGTDVGKGLFVLTMSMSLAFKFSSFGFNVDRARKVYLLDGETPESRMGSHLEQLKIAYNLYNTNKEYSDNLIIHCQLDSDILVDIATEKGRSQFKDMLVYNKFDVLVIDNLNTFCREFVKSALSWSIFENWLLSFKQFNISIIIVHHALKYQNDIHKGPAEMVSQTQNVINLKKYEVDDKINYSAGASISLSFLKCKVMPKLKQSKFAFYLEDVDNISQSKPWINLNITEDVSNDLHILSDFLKEEYKLIYKSFCDIKKSIMSHAFLNEKFSRKDIESITKLKQTASGSLIQSLKNNNFIISVDDGKNTKYKINPIIFI